MKRLFLKNVWSSRADYGVLLGCGSFVIMIIYVTVRITDGIVQRMLGEPASATQVYSNLGAFLLTYIMLAFLMVLMTLAYIRKRIYDYKMLEALGIRKKHKNLFMAGEFGSIVILSMLIGSLAGVLVGTGINYLSGMFLGAGEIHAAANRVPLRLTLIISGVLFFAIFIICYTLISDLGMDNVISMGRGSGRAFRVSAVKIIFGVLFIAGSFMSLFMYWGKVNKVIPLTVAAAGMIFLAASLVGIWLERTRNSRNYYKKLLWLEQWYDRFYYNSNLSIVIAGFILIILFFFGIKICDQYPLTDQDEYPYDLVWMANREDTDFLKALKEKYGAVIQTKEFVRVTTPDFSENMGISETEYEAWTGREIELSEDEIFVVYQRTRDRRSLLGIDYGAGRPRLHLGNAEQDLWLNISPDKPVASAGFEKRYRKMGEEDRILTGIFESRALPKYQAGVWENIIVFSDEDYEKFDGNTAGADLAVLIDYSEEEDCDAMRKEISAYAEEHSQRNFLDYKNEPIIYEKSEEVLKIQKDQILGTASAGINIFILMLCILFILWTKGKCDYEELRWKYQFFTLSGISESHRRRNFRKEIFLFPVIALLGGLPMAALFVTADVLQKRLGMEDNMRYLAGLSGIGGAVVFLILIFTGILVCVTGRKIKKETV